jgi:ferric-dicitrate binding protein FerR (iron transport regulator)
LVWLVAAVLLCPAAHAQDQAQDQAQGPSEGQSGQPVASVNIGRDVVVVEGDTLRSIAQRELGRRAYASFIAEFNSLALDDTLAVGSVLRIPINVPDRGEAASVVYFKGDANLNGSPLEDAAAIVVGDSISTGSDGFISMEFSNGSVVYLQPESTAILQQLNCLESDDRCVIEIETTDGSLTSDVEPRDGQPLEFRVTTPYASAAVRGTVFDMSADPESLKVAVTEGLVDIAALGATVSLNEGFGSVTNAGEPPGEPVELLPAPAFRNVPGRVAIGDNLLWWALSEVDSYAARVSRDSSGIETVAEVVASGDRIEVAGIGGVDPGAYFLSLRGIDDNGLRGFESSTRVVVAGIDPDLVSPKIVVTREGNDTLVSVVEPAPDARGFEIQISESDDFSDPLTVDVGPTGTAVFRIDNDEIFARARRLVDPTTVSAFGPIAQAD